MREGIRFVERVTAAAEERQSQNSLLAYRRTWTLFLAWAAAAIHPRSLLFPTWATCHGRRKNAAGFSSPRPRLPCLQAMGLEKGLNGFALRIGFEIGPLLRRAGADHSALCHDN